MRLKTIMETETHYAQDVKCHDGGLETKIFLLKNLIYIDSCIITVRRVELSQLWGVLKNADMVHAYLRHVISF